MILNHTSVILFWAAMLLLILGNRVIPAGEGISPSMERTILKMEPEEALLFIGELEKKGKIREGQSGLIRQKIIEKL